MTNNVAEIQIKINDNSLKDAVQKLKKLRVEEEKKVESSNKWYQNLIKNGRIYERQQAVQLDKWYQGLIKNGRLQEQMDVRRSISANKWYQNLINNGRLQEQMEAKKAQSSDKWYQNAVKVGRLQEQERRSQLNKNVSFLGSAAMGMANTLGTGLMGLGGLAGVAVYKSIQMALQRNTQSAKDMQVAMYNIRIEWQRILVGMGEAILRSGILQNTLKAITKIMDVLGPIGMRIAVIIAAFGGLLGVGLRLTTMFIGWGTQFGKILKAVAAIKSLQVGGSIAQGVTSGIAGQSVGQTIGGVAAGQVLGSSVISRFRNNRMGWNRVNETFGLKGNIYDILTPLLYSIVGRDSNVGKAMKAKGMMGIHAAHLSESVGQSGKAEIIASTVSKKTLFAGLSSLLALFKSLIPLLTKLAGVVALVTTVFGVLSKISNYLIEDFNRVTKAISSTTYGKNFITVWSNIFSLLLEIPNMIIDGLSGIISGITYTFSSLASGLFGGEGFDPNKFWARMSEIFDPKSMKGKDFLFGSVQKTSFAGLQDVAQSMAADSVNGVREAIVNTGSETNSRLDRLIQIAEAGFNPAIQVYKGGVNYAASLFSSTVFAK